MPKPVLLLEVTIVTENGKKRFELNMKDIDMQTPQDPATPEDLAEIKVWNKTGYDVHLFFPSSKSPCDPSEIEVNAGLAMSLAWKSTVNVQIYYYTVTELNPSVGATVGGKGVMPTSGTIEIEVME